MSDTAKFTMIDENFICEVCGKEVKHVDVNPGDRLCTCHGILQPVAIEPAKKEKYKIVYKCNDCGMIKRNIMAEDDNFEKILEIMSNPVSV